MESHGFNVKYEFDQKKKERDEGYDDVFVAPDKRQNTSSDNKETNDKVIGRPTLDDDERTSDPGNSETGAAPKPSAEEGSERQNE